MLLPLFEHLKISLSPTIINRKANPFGIDQSQEALTKKHGSLIK